jgi:hypothetical protein
MIVSISSLSNFCAAIPAAMKDLPLPDGPVQKTTSFSTIDLI